MCVFICVACRDRALYLKSCRKLKYSWLLLCFSWFAINLPWCSLGPSLPRGSVFTPEETLFTCCVQPRNTLSEDAATSSCGPWSSLFTLPVSFSPSHSLSLALSLIWLAQANIIIRSSEEKPALIFQPLERGPSIKGWWEDHRQSITLYEVVHVPTHEEAPRHASRWHLPAPSSGLPGLWRPSFLKGPNLISLFKWCSLNWISKAWVTTAKVPNFLLCWVTNGAVQPTGGDIAVAIMTPWLVWALGPQPTWTESLYQDQPPQFRQWARQTLPALCFYSSREVQSLWITSPFIWWLWFNYQKNMI